MVYGNYCNLLLIITTDNNLPMKPQSILKATQEDDRVHLSGKFLRYEDMFQNVVANWHQSQSCCNLNCSLTQLLAFQFVVITGAPPNERYHADQLEALDLFLAVFRLGLRELSEAHLH